MEKPEKCVSVDQARKLQEDWVNTRAKEIQRAQGYEDTREFLYKLEELQEYLDYVKEKSREQGIANPGIRLYFGAYPKSQQKKSYSTLFLAPTQDVSEVGITGEGSVENNYEIEPLNNTQGGFPPKSY